MRLKSGIESDRETMTYAGKANFPRVIGFSDSIAGQEGLTEKGKFFREKEDSGGGGLRKVKRP